MTYLLENPGEAMHHLASRLFPLNRSLTGKGLRQSLQILAEAMPDLTCIEIPTGTKVNDWTVPEEWWINEAWIRTIDGHDIVNFANSNLHVVGYSTPIDSTLTREELDEHLYSLPELPDAIPYVTSYYEKRWGFCISENTRNQLGDGPFLVKIDSGHTHGSLTYGELLLQGASESEVLLSSYICHPSLANNELSGPVVMAALYQWLKTRPNLRYSYRFFIGPETIGPIAYLATHLRELQEKVVAGWVLTCLGDNRTFSFVPSRNGHSLADRISKEVLSKRVYDTYSYLERGSDERQWCAPGVNLPVCSLMRSKYGTYPEYHTSYDDLEFISPEGLEGGFQLLIECLEKLENEPRWVTNVIGEPQMSRRNLYSTLSTTDSAVSSKPFMDVLAYCDGSHDLAEISSLTLLSRSRVREVVKVLLDHGLVREI